MPEFKPEHGLYRRIHPDFWSKKDGRPTSAAFQDPNLSVDWSILSTPKESFDRAKDKRIGIASVTVENALDLGQDVVHDPLHENGILNEAHTLIVGDKPRSIARQFAKLAVMVISINSLSDLY